MTDQDQDAHDDTSEDDMGRSSAWGNVRRTQQAAINDAVDELGKLAAGTRQKQVGRENYEEIRKTPTGYQARVSARMQPRGDD